jgi:hypothetical protein
MRMSSLEAAEFFEARLLQVNYRPLHFVFLDDDHDYPYVLEEIEAWNCCLSQGGIIAGHDWTPEFWGVQKSVEAFFGVGRATIQGRSWVVRPRNWHAQGAVAK